jgi:hypothetical protein
MSIMISAKPKLEVLDFVGNAGNHDITGVEDILGGEYDDEVILEYKKVKKKASSEPRDVEEELEKVKITLDAKKRSNLIGSAKYTKKSTDIFSILHVSPVRERGWDKGRPLSYKMEMLLEKNNIKHKGMTFTEAKQLCAKIIQGYQNRECTVKMKVLLARFGYDANQMPMTEGRELIDAIVANGWKRPDKELIA